MDGLHSTQLTDDNEANTTKDLEANVTTEDHESPTPDEPNEHGNFDDLAKEADEESEANSDDDWASAGAWESTETPEYVDNRTPLEIVQEEVNSKWKTRNESSRYSRAIVLLISWEEHDLGDEVEEAQNKFQETFEYLYKYDVRRFRIPKKKPYLALNKQLLDLAEWDSPDTLFIVWYDGHGSEHEDRRGSPIWYSHEESRTSLNVDSSVVSTTLADCEADILLVNNSCSSLTCGRFRSKGIVESISASAFDTITYGSPTPNDLSPSMSWAALRILRNRGSVEEGITVVEFHRQICLAVQWGSDYYPECDGDNVYFKQSHIRTQPVYTRLSADSVTAHGRTQGIVLRQLTCEDDIEFPKPFIYKPDLLLRLLVTSLDDMDPKQWTDWVLSAPSCVQTALLEKPENEEDSTN
ncbi:hypothetical protein NPX13_g1712 [Xylaria arbuscula]|uniref:Uncharacterized protein n=1 Tax=Xylaria arbuscula TaxID=114810 RepID=A0A9W8NLJ2_9PEZI|nr:hypothetical protein NPX13_g1712 [Xylaria arbuscula]